MWRLYIVLGLAVLNGACVTGVARHINGEEDRMRLGQEAFAGRDFVRAREHYLVAVKEAPGNTHALFRLGNIALYDGQSDEALGYYERVLAIDPKFARAHYNLAVIHLGRAEDHFNYYAATLDNGQSIEAPLVKLLVDMEAFATPEETRSVKSSDPLDSLGELLGSGTSSP